MPAVVYASIAAAANILGALAISVGPSNARKRVDLVLALSAGFLVAVALGELVPEAIAKGGAGAGWWMLGAFALVHLTQHTFVRHFHFGEEVHAVTDAVARSALIGLILHTFVDGVAIATSFAVDARMGALVLTAIALHKLPEGLAIASLFVAAGRTRAAAVGAATALGVATIVGATLSSNVDFLVIHGLAISAGVTLYVAGSNLIPEFQLRGSWTQNAWFFAGIIGYGAVVAALH